MCPQVDVSWGRERWHCSVCPVSRGTQVIWLVEKWFNLGPLTVQHTNKCFTLNVSSAQQCFEWNNVDSFTWDMFLNASPPLKLKLPFKALISKLYPIVIWSTRNISHMCTKPKNLKKDCRIQGTSKGPVLKLSVDAVVLMFKKEFKRSLQSQLHHQHLRSWDVQQRTHQIRDEQQNCSS